MAQIIKHRRGLIGGVKNLTARNGELIIASGSISDLSGPFVFIGSPNTVDEGVAGAFNSVSKLYTGTAAPTITAATYGSALDGTPYYASGNKSLYILNNSNVGNTQVDLTGNIEGNTISGVTINNLQSTNITASFVSGAFSGDATGLYNIPASGVTGLNLSKIYSGSVQVTTDAVTGDIHLDADNAIYASASSITLTGGNSSYMSLSTGGYAAVYSYQGGTDVTADGGGNLWLWSEGGGNTNVASYDGGVVNLSTDGNSGDIYALNGDGNKLYINGDVELTGSLFATKIEGTGSLYLQPDQGDSRLFEIYNTTGVTGSDIHIHGINGISYFGNDTNYLKLDDGSGNATIIGDNSVNISSNVGSVYISSYDGSTLELNTDGGEGDINLGNNTNDVYGHTNTTNFTATNYAQLEASSSYVWVENLGAHLHNDSGSAGVGFTARPDGIIEATGSLDIYGDTQISGNTSITGALVVADGSATFDQGLVAQNSNMLLTSGSALIVQDSGYVKTNFIEGNTDQYNYLSLNGNGLNGQAGVELSSTQNISLWAEGGTVNVTGSLVVSGDIIFSGSINIGDYSGDTVNFNGEVSSSIIPQTGSSFDLGSSGKTWNNVWAENAHFTNINIGSIELNSLALPGDLTVSGTTQFSGSVAISGLTEGRIVTVGNSGSLVDSNAFNWNSGSAQLGVSGSIKLNDSAYIYNDGALFVEDNTNGVTIQSNNYAELQSSNAWLWAEGNNAYVEGGNYTQIKTDSGNVDISSYDGGNLNLNNDGGEGNVNIGNGSNNLNINSNTYVDTDKTLYVNNIWDNSDNSNYLQLYGWNTNDGYWWEGGDGLDTTLLNNINNANLNILQTNNGDVNIDATQGSVNIHSANGMNVTGSLVVSDASGVFNSSLNVSNSDLTLDGGSDIHMNDSAHLYFDTCVDLYWDNGTNDFVVFNDCGGIQLRNNVSITGSINVSGNINSDYIYGTTNNNNYLSFNGSPSGAPDVELESSGQISLWAEGGNVNMTGSVHVTNDLDVSGSVYLGQIYNYNSNINGGAIYIDANDYVEISHNDGDAFFGVDGGGIYGTSNVGVTTLTSNAGDTTIAANNGYNVNINAANILLNGPTAITGAFTVSSGSMTSLGGDLYVSGNLQVLGSSTNVTIQSQTVDIGDNIIQVNAYSPFDRYAGLAAYDSGSSGASGSFLWDSTNDYWLIVNANGDSSRIIGTTASTGSTGTEISLTSGTFPIATASNTIGDSLLAFSGTTLSYNTNKFTVDSDTGNVYISGNLTITDNGDDLGSKTSAVTFINSDNVVGFVSTTETTNELDGILGYNTSTGVLEFSTLIDGGTY